VDGGGRSEAVPEAERLFGNRPHRPGAGSNGLAFDREGRLVLCQHGNRRIARREKDGSFTVLADRFQGKRLNSPNDLVFRSNGDLYFTDPPTGFRRPSSRTPGAS
jgi:gluconolactonase